MPRTAIAPTVNGITYGLAWMNAKTVGSVMRGTQLIDGATKASTNAANETPITRIASKIIANHNILCAVSIFIFFSPFGGY